MNRSLILGAVAVSLSVIVISRCSQSVKTIASGSGAKYAKVSDLNLAQAPYDEANIIIAGIVMPASLTARHGKGTVEFVLKLTDEYEIDIEYYQYDDKSFRFAGTPDESYEPAIPLARFPFTVGDAWSWKGESTFAGKTRDATATVTTGTETLNLAGGHYETIVITIELSTDVDSAEPAVRKMKFWVAPKHGIVRREFDFDVAREPRPIDQDDGP
ncbi:MAG: hypothetical protein IH944_03525 [Armatimonadetes bacterium]|nr:hypothetical protein [Armatimonadota bacterium]